jgi:hypothetical protein
MARALRPEQAMAEIHQELPNWSGLGVADFANRQNMRNFYDEDDRFLSNMAHGSSAGSLVKIADGKSQITDDSAATQILAYGTRYMLAVTEVWNAPFKVIEESKMIAFRNACLNFDCQQATHDIRNSSS